MFNGHTAENQALVNEVEEKKWEIGNEMSHQTSATYSNRGLDRVYQRFCGVSPTLDWSYREKDIGKEGKDVWELVKPTIVCIGRGVSASSTNTEP